MRRAIIAGALLFALCPKFCCADSHEEGFVALFDGQTLSGWIGEGLKHFDVESGTLVSRPGCSGKLLAEREYADFILRFEFKLTPGANNGLAIRSLPDGDSAYRGIELQILDNPAEKYENLHPYQYHGSAYGIAPAKRGALKPVGEWNQQEVHCQGRKIKVVLNDETILDIDLDEAAPDGKTIDGKAHPGLSRESGYVGFLCHGDVVSFRNIRIKVLPK